MWAPQTKLRSSGFLGCAIPFHTILFVHCATLYKWLEHPGLGKTKHRNRTFIDLIINHFHPFWPSMVSSLCLPYTVIMVLKSVPLYLVSWIFRCFYLVRFYMVSYSLHYTDILIEMFEIYCFSYFSIGTYITDYCHFLYKRSQIYYDLKTMCPLTAWYTYTAPIIIILLPMVLILLLE